MVCTDIGKDMEVILRLPLGLCEHLVAIVIFQPDNASVIGLDVALQAAGKTLWTECPVNPLSCHLHDTITFAFLLALGHFA